jgi:hypothetical protein
LFSGNQISPVLLLPITQIQAVDQLDDSTRAEDTPQTSRYSLLKDGKLFTQHEEFGSVGMLPSLENSDNISFMQQLVRLKLLKIANYVNQSYIFLSSEALICYQL